MVVIQQDLYNILRVLYSNLIILKKSTSNKLKKNNVSFESYLLLPNQNSSIISKNITKPKLIHYD